MGLTPALGRGPVAIDATVVIYYVEAHPEYVAFADQILNAAMAGAYELVTSSMTLLRFSSSRTRSATCSSSSGSKRF